jgi:N-acetylmuramic acid 6-phosphate (MurNAc-6-P) etherase
VLSHAAVSVAIEAPNDVEEHARMTPVPPIGSPRSFISPRMELTGNRSASRVPLGVAVLGFNPANLARNVPLMGLENKSFRDVIATFDNRDSWPWRVLVNPVVGPEAVSGSSRMKGGSATLAVLDIICLKAISALLPREHHLRELAELSVSQLLNKYQQCLTITYSSCTPRLPQIMDRCAQALRSGGHIYYIGIESAAVMGCIDVSEMPDTYGAPFDQTRAFIVGGWEALGNKDGDISSRSRLHRISLGHFVEDVLPNLGSNDSVVVLISGPVVVRIDELSRTICDVKATEAMLSYLIVCSESESDFLENNLMGISSADLYSFVEVPLNHEGFHDFSMKLMLNAVTTYSQAAGRGAIYKSHMIATGPANDKIYVRCLGLIATHLNISEREANVALIRSIYGLDIIDDALLESPRSVHINKAVLAEDKRHQSQIILPVAFLCNTDKCIF